MGEKRKYKRLSLTVLYEAKDRAFVTTEYACEVCSVSVSRTVCTSRMEERDPSIFQDKFSISLDS